MALPLNPGAYLEAVMQAIAYRLSQITTANGYANRVLLAHDLEQVLRDPTVQDAGGERGILAVVEEEGETYEYLHGMRVRATLTYQVRISVAVNPEHPLSVLRELVRSLRGDLWRNHHSDLHLCEAYAATGGADEQLVMEHRIRDMQSEYAFPEGLIAMSADCKYDFSADAL